MLVFGNIIIRPIQPEDNQAIAGVIRKTMEEFGVNKRGTVYFDPTTDALYQLFQTPESVYYVAVKDSAIVGGGGIYPTEGLPEGTCELVKMYLMPQMRGIGLGRQLIEQCLQFAKSQAYHFVYLETMPELRPALKAYEKCGFEFLQQPMGQSGHYYCQLWMRKEL